jgi:hypothetical protein
MGGGSGDETVINDDDEAPPQVKASMMALELDRAAIDVASMVSDHAGDVIELNANLLTHDGVQNLYTTLGEGAYCDSWCQRCPHLAHHQNVKGGLKCVGHLGCNRDATARQTEDHGTLGCEACKCICELAASSGTVAEAMFRLFHDNLP